MNFWDHVERFRNSILSEDSTLPRPKDIRPSISYLRKIFEPYWHDNLSRVHPLYQRLTASHIQNDLWLEQFAKKIHILNEIPGNLEIIKRLAHPEEYLGAAIEMDSALAFLVSGLRVTFVDRTSAPTVDLMVARDNEEFAVEISSLNTSRDFERMDRVSTYATFQAFKQKENLISGGMVIHPPKNEDILANMLQQIDEAISQAAQSGYKKVNFPGVATLYFAKKGHETRIPDDCRNQFKYGKLTTRDAEDRIISKIDQKWEQLGRQRNPGFLLIDSGFVGVEEMNALFANSFDNIDIALGVYPKMMAFGVSCNVRFMNPTLPFSQAGSKVSFGAEIATGENRNFYFWKNRHADLDAPSYLFEAFRNYASNLKSAGA